MTFVERAGERYYEAEMWRIKGELLLKAAEGNAQSEAESCYQKAIEIAWHQNAKSWELRAANSLARLWQQQGKIAKARQMLSKIYDWFTEGFDTRDLKIAKAMLDEMQPQVKSFSQRDEPDFDSLNVRSFCEGTRGDFSMMPPIPLKILSLVFAISLFSLSAHPATQAEQPIEVHVNGVELHYVERGKGEPLIFIHGASGDYRSWMPEMELFSKDYRVISYSRRYNYPNHNVRFQKDHSVYAEAKDLSALIQKLKLQHVYLVGNSYGAYTALVLALEHPGMVRSLVLAEPPVHQLIRDTPDGEAVYNDFMSSCMKPAAEAFKANDDERAMKILSDGIIGSGRWDALPAEVRAARMQNSLFFKVLTSSTNPFPNLSQYRLKRLTVPTLIVTGENTTRIHKMVDEKLASLLANARAVIIPKASHGSNRDNPEAYQRAVSEFLRDQKRGGVKGARETEQFLAPGN